MAYDSIQQEMWMRTSFLSLAKLLEFFALARSMQEIQSGFVLTKRYSTVRLIIRCMYSSMQTNTNFAYLNRYFPLIRAFQATNGSMSDLVEEISGMKEGCKVWRLCTHSIAHPNWLIPEDTSLLATFSENHDQPRFASYTPDLSVSITQFP